jgi:Holliday junction resolvasome RuvABC endonuclease subunit
MRILALDLASTTGYALYDSEEEWLKIGNWKLTNDKHPEPGYRFFELYCQLEKYEDLDIIAYERVDFHRAKIAETVYSGLRAIVEFWAFEQCSRVLTVAVSTIKKTLSGKGNATKEEMVEAANGMYGIKMGGCKIPKVNTHDEADALGVLLWAMLHENIIG